MLSRVAFHPLLFAAYGVLSLYAANVSEVLYVDVVVPLGRTLIGVAAVCAASALVFRDARRGAVVASASTVAFFGFGHLAGSLGDSGIEERLQLAAWAGVVLAAVAYAFRARASLPRTTSLLNAVAGMLVLLSVVTVAPYEYGRIGRGAAGAAVVATPGAGGGGAGRDVYFVVFDRYGSASAIERHFGVSNDLPAWLEGRGFQVADRSHANYRATDFSLAATLNMSFLDRLTREVGPASSDRTPARRMLLDHAVGRTFRSLGYRYVHLGSWYSPTITNPLADESPTFGVSSEFEAVLHDTTIVPAVERLLRVERAGLTFRDRHREIALFQFRQLRRLASTPGPKFVFAHILLPHAPYVFRADGTIIAEDEARAADERDLYAGQLAFLNGHIRELVGALLAGPDDKDPIIVLQADEGPFLCRNVDCAAQTPEELAVRFGIFDAFYLPSLSGVPVPETFTPVNTFRLIFRAYFGADLPPLPDRSFTWPDNDHLYDFRDVTDQLAEGTAARLDERAYSSR